MSKYTEDAPFMAQGVRIWRDSKGQVDYTTSRYDTSETALAMHAFIEAEREGWHWTEDDPTEARNGRWVAARHTSAQWAEDGDGVYLAHDDVMDGVHDRYRWSFSTNFLRTGPDSKLGRVAADFLAWAEAQDQPEEPTEPEPTPERSSKHVATIKLTLDTAGLADDLERVVAAIRGVLDRPEVDPLAHVKEGDTDPTPNVGPWCMADSDDGLFDCSREPGHPGQHIAGDGDRVVAVWPQESAS